MSWFIKLLATVVMVLGLQVAVSGCAAPPQIQPTPAATTPAAPNVAPTNVASSRTRISFAYSNIIADFLPLWMARETGTFEKNGLDVDLQYIASSNAFAALLADQVQATAGGGPEVVSGTANGASVVVIANLMPIYPYVMEAPASIRSPAELKGGSIAITNPGATFDIASRVALRKVGLDPAMDVQFVKTGSVANVQTALMSGQVQGGLAQVPDTLKLEAAGLHPLIDLSTLNAPAASTVVTMQRAYVDANPHVPLQIVRSLLQAYAIEKSDPSTTVNVLKQYLKSDDDTAMRATYDYFVSKVAPVAPTPEQFADGVGILAEQNPAIKNVDLNKIMDATYFSQASNP